MAIENNGEEHSLDEQEHAARRLALRENAKRVLQDSGLAQMLQEINKNELRRRGMFEEYDSLVLLKWGTGYTRRHIWVEVNAFMQPRNRVQGKHLAHRGG